MEIISKILPTKTSQCYITTSMDLQLFLDKDLLYFIGKLVVTTMVVSAMLKTKCVLTPNIPELKIGWQHLNCREIESVYLPRPVNNML